MIDADFWRDRRVLITGHSGFKGVWLTLWLQALGARVSGLSGSPPSAPSLYELARLREDVESFEADIRDPDAVTRAVAAARPEVVLHMAAQALVRRSFEAPRETYEINTMGTVNLLDAVRTHGTDVRAVVVVTSDKCYENREWEWGYRESEPMGGHDPYSSSKGAAELVASAFRRSFFASPDGPRIASARAGNVIGGGDWGQDRLVPDLMRAALAGEELRVRNPNSVRPWQHVLNPLSGYLLLAQSLSQNREDPDLADGWNFGPEERDARTVGWLVEQLVALWPRRLRWSIDEGEHPHEARYLKLDSSRARRRLGWRAPVELESALASIAGWYASLSDGADMRQVTLDQLTSLSSQAATGTGDR